MTVSDTIGKVRQKAKIAAGLFWADYAVLGEQVRELEAAGVDWFHIEVRDGKYMDFGMPRGGFDIIEGVRKSTSLEIEAQLQMMRPGFDVFDQLAELGVNLISLPIETTNETLMQNITYIKEKLELKVGKSPHTIDPIVVSSVRRLHEMIVAAGMEDRIELMEDGGLSASNVAEFVEAGMTVGEFSSPLLKGPNGKLVPGTGEITAAVRRLRAVMDEASDRYRDERGLMR